jgi:hypothetical protein
MTPSEKWDALVSDLTQEQRNQLANDIANASRESIQAARIAALEAETARIRERLEMYEGEKAERDLSTYAFSEYGNDARLYNGVQKLEAENARLTRERDGKDRARLIAVGHWEDAQNRLADIERKLIEITGHEGGIDDNIAELRADRERLDAMIANGWCVYDFWGGEPGRFAVRRDDVVVSCDQESARAAIDAARKAGACSPCEGCQMR